MFSIDLRTMVGIAAFALLLLTITTFAAWRGMRKQVGGLGHWTLGDAAMFLSAILFATRGMLPSLVSIIAANALFFCAYALWAAGTMEFNYRPSPRRALIAIVAAVTLALCWFLYVDENYRMRLVVASCGGIALVAMHVASILRYGKKNCFLTRVFIGTLILQGLVFALRGVTALASYSTGTDLFSENLVQTTYLGLTQFLVLSLALEFSLLAGLRMHNQMEKLALIDPLTQALNRRGLFDEFGRAFDSARKDEGQLSVLAADLDHFRRYNDSHGNEAGDVALLRVATTITAKLGPGASFGRVGGEDFCVVLPGADSEQAAQIAERLRAAIEDCFRDLPTPLTASIGIATMQANDIDARQLLRRADAALLRAKAAGRNRSVPA